MFLLRTGPRGARSRAPERSIPCDFFPRSTTPAAADSTLVKNGDNTFTLTSKFGPKWNFGTTGLLTNVVDLNGNTVSYTYSSGKLSQIDDPFSRDTTFTYTTGYLTSFTDHASRTTTLTQTGGKLTMVTHPDPDGGGALAAPETDYAYSATTHLLTSTTDPLNYATSFAFDTDTERLETITYPDSSIWTLTPQQTMGFATGSGNSLYDPASAIAQYVDQRAKTWQFQTDRFGNVIYFKDPLNNVTLTERDHNGRPIRLTQADPDGAGALTSPVTKLGYNTAGDQVKSYLPDGNVQTWTYHTTFHGPLTYTNELNKTWENTYHSTTGNLLTAEDPLGNITTYTHSAIGLVETITTADPDGGGSQTASVTEFDYDAYGRLELQTNPDASEREFTYNSADLLLTMTDELSHVWSRAYDTLNRLTSETTPDPDAGGGLTASTTSYAYNANSWLTKVTDALSNATDYTLNNRGFVTQIERPDPDGGGALGRPTSTYTYNALGQVTEEGQPTMLTTNVVYSYNDAGWLTSKMGPVNTLVGTLWTYDNLGRVTKVTRGSELTPESYLKRTYNSRGWVTSTIESVYDMGLIDGPTTTFTHDAAGQLIGVTDARGYSTAYAYGDAGWLTKITQADPDGSAGGLISPVIQFGYDNLGRQTTQTDPLGRITATLYDNRHRVIKVTRPDPDGAGSATAPETEYEYDAANRLTGVINPLDQETNYAYDNANRLLTITLPDPDGVGGASSPVTTYAYNAMNSVTSETDALSNVTSFTYDTLQRQTQVTQADPDAGGPLASPVTNFTYNAQGLLAEVTDPLSHDTTFGYDDFGRRTTVTNHDGHVTTTAFDDYSRVLSVTTPDPDGVGGETTSITSYAYDRQDRVTQITDPRNGATVFTYDVMGNLTNLRDALSNDTSWTYDGLSRVTQETNELASSRYFVYDAASNLIRKTDRNSRVTRYVYDNLDRLTSELWIDSGTPTPTATGATTTQGGAVSEVQRVGYESMMTITGGTFTLTYDGQTTGGIAYDAAAAAVQSALEALSNIGAGEVAVVKTSDTSMQQEWRLTFQGTLAGTNLSQTTIDTSNLQYMMAPTDIEATDTQGSTNSEVQTVTLADATAGTFRLTFGSEQTGTIAYDASAATVDTALEALSNLDTVTVTGNAGGPYTITFTGTHANTNVAQITGDATYLTSGTVDKTITNVYDAASQLTSTGDTSNSNAYTYDNMGRRLTDTQTISGLTPTVVLTSAYNANSRRTSLAATIGGTADFKNDYAYDNLNRLTQIVQQDVSGGNVVADKRIDFVHNAIGQYTTLTRYQSTDTSTLVATTTFAYDTLNRLTDLDHKQNSTNLNLYDLTYDAMNRIASITSTADGASTFTYDKESQVTAADHASPQADESYGYDATGNRNTTGYTTASNNRTTADGTYTYEYDSEGNRSKRTKTSTGDYEEYTWDHRNRLTKVTFKDSMDTVLKTVEHSYDTLNRWVRRTYDSDGPGGAAATDTFFAGYDGINQSLQFSGSAASNLDHRYLFNPDVVDQILVDEDVVNLTSAGNVTWPLADHQGTLRDIADLNEGSGVTTVTNHRFYDGFGNLKSETNAAVDLVFGFMGKPLDEVTGHYNFWSRIYDPFLAKFISHDPIGFGGGDVNLSRLVGNNAVNLVDPYGLEGEPAPFEGNPDPSNPELHAWMQAWHQYMNPGYASNWSYTPNGGFLFTPAYALLPEGTLDTIGGLLENPVSTWIGQDLIAPAWTATLGVDSLANASDGALIEGTVLVSTVAAFGILYGGEVLLGVGTYGAPAVAPIAPSGGALMPGATVYRVFGGGSQMYGSYWTTVNPATVPLFNAGAGLPASNAGVAIAQGTLLNTTGVTVSSAAPSALTPAGAVMIPQVIIPNPLIQVWITHIIVLL